MKNFVNPKNREKLQQTMMSTLQGELHSLSPEFQSILIDDLITAFYSRLVTLNKFC